MQAVSATHRAARKIAMLKHLMKSVAGLRERVCLRIEEPSQTRWLYESADVIDYLEQEFGTGA